MNLKVHSSFGCKRNLSRISRHRELQPSTILFCSRNNLSLKEKFLDLKKGQAWSFDVMVAAGIFIIALVSFYFYALNYNSESDNFYKSLVQEGNVIGENLLSSGSPNNWTTVNVIKIGLLTGNEIDDEKLETFYNLSLTDYQREKKLLNTKYDFYINFSQPMVINGNNVNLIGNYNPNPENLIRVSRFAIYKNTPTTIYIHVWE